VHVLSCVAVVMLDANTITRARAVSSLNNHTVTNRSNRGATWCGEINAVVWSRDL